VPDENQVQKVTSEKVGKSPPVSRGAQRERSCVGDRSEEFFRGGIILLVSGELSSADDSDERRSPIIESQKSARTIGGGEGINK
jgi:hypothetical protein